MALIAFHLNADKETGSNQAYHFRITFESIQCVDTATSVQRVKLGILTSSLCAWFLDPAVSDPAVVTGDHYELRFLSQYG